MYMLNCYEAKDLLTLQSISSCTLMTLTPIIFYESAVHLKSILQETALDRSLKPSDIYASVN